MLSESAFIPTAGFISSNLYLLIAEYHGRFNWLVCEADQFLGRVYWGRRVGSGRSTSRVMASSAGRNCATQYVYNNRPCAFVDAC